jgi:hypothetical protein
MAIDRKGYKNIITSTTPQNQIKKDIFNSFLSTSNWELVIGRVTDIVLNDEHNLFDTVGKYNGLGTITFEINGEVSSTRDFAKPLTPQSSYFPLINELVLLFLIPDTNIGKSKDSKSYYYLNIINLWNNPHHNAYPDPEEYNTPNQQQNTLNDYKKTDGGIVRRVTDNSTDIRLNTKNNNSQVTFKEEINIHPLKCFTGDLLNQGRFGNSIRLGSTNQYINLKSEVTSSNNWSSNKENGTTTGSPIIMIRNGQSVNPSLPSWEPITENINNDKSSIYLTSNQLIDINPSSKEYSSYTESAKETPTSPSKYKSNQVIINSGRLLFNSKTDHILLSSQRTINFNAQKGFNFDTPSNFVIDVGTTIKLGDKTAKESLILGDTFLRNLDFVIEGIEILCKALGSSTIWPAGVGTTSAPEVVAANTVLTRTKKFRTQIDEFKSTVSKTI